MPAESPRQIPELPRDYELDADIENTASDRRKRHDWRAVAVFPKGLRLRVIQENLGSSKEPLWCTVMVAGKGKGHDGIYERDPRFGQILAQSHAVETPLRERLSDADVSAAEVLEYLIESGKVSLSDEDLRAACERAAV